MCAVVHVEEPCTIPIYGFQTFVYSSSCRQSKGLEIIFSHRNFGQFNTHDMKSLPRFMSVDVHEAFLG